MPRILNLTIQICSRQGSGFGVSGELTKREVLATLLKDLEDPNGIDNYTRDPDVKVTGINAETNEVIEL
jgi:hypothetical protein